MTKIELQKELKAKVKPGVKPSQLRKSKSLSSIPKAPPLPKPTPLTKSKSAEELEPLTSSRETIEQLETKISVLELKLEVNQRELKEEKADKTLFSEQLKEKQQEIESLREKLEKVALELNSLKKEKSILLDDNLALKHQGLKDWFQQYQQTQKLEKELAENIEYASEELVRQDQTISKLRAENSRLKQTNQSLEKDLKLVEKLAELRREPLDLVWPSLPSFSWITLVLTALALWFLMKPNHDL